MISIVILLFSLGLSVSVPKHPSLIEISARPWLYELGKKYGKTISSLAQVPDAELKDLASRGYNILWLMGVWKLGDAGLKHDRTDAGLLASYSKVLPGWTKDDVIGSPYAIVNYTINPALGTDLKAFADRVHALGMQFYVDLVPNHSATDMSLVTSTPSLYIRAPPSFSPPYDPSVYLTNGVAYGKDPYSGAWTDTAQYNIWEPKMRTQLISFINEAAKVADGVRCDMAMLLINDVFKNTWGTQLSAWNYSQPSTEFWAYAISQIKRSYPNFAFMAEVYWGREQQLLSMGFDYMYDKDGLYNKLTDGNLDNIRAYIKNNDLSKMTHFTENHDEDRAISHFGSVARANAAAVISMTLPGMKFYFQGQTDGKKNKLDVHLRRSADESVRSEVVTFYNRLQTSLKSSVFHSGTWSYQNPIDVDGSSWRLLCWKWKQGKDKKLVVINYSDGQASARIQCPDAAEKATSSSVLVYDELNNVTYSRDVNEMKNPGLYVTLGAWQAHIFDY